MDKAVEFKLCIKRDFSSDLVEELRHIDKYFSEFINTNVEIIVMELDESHAENFTVEINGKKIDNPSISEIVDIANKEALENE